ncbi:MAG: 3-phosphoshikimate 1-carboxyvinyltransferase [Myxococcota bacterium]
MSLRLIAPTSKSMTQRALVLAALSEAPVTVRRPLVCDDSTYLTDLLRQLGHTVSWSSGVVTVEPVAPPWTAPSGAVLLGNAGTAVRFGSCLSLLVEGDLTIDGTEHMRRRPLGPLGDALSDLGVEVGYPMDEGCPPVTYRRRKTFDHERPSVDIDTTKSSQYASGLAMVGPRLPQGLIVRSTGAKVSRPYWNMTLAMMDRHGASVVDLDEDRIAIAPGGYAGGNEIVIEPDWSGAAFLLAAGRIINLPVEVEGLPDPRDSLQGDAEFAAMLRTLDQPPDKDAYEFDIIHCSDLIAPLAAACVFASAPSRIRGAAHTRHKECDRVAVLATELQKVGIDITPLDDGLDIVPHDPSQVVPGRPVLNPDEDHRMAMAFALVGLRLPLEVSSKACVAKSFPNFWDAYETIRAAKP